MKDKNGSTLFFITLGICITLMTAGSYICLSDGDVSLSPEITEYTFSSSEPEKTVSDGEESQTEVTETAASVLPASAEAKGKIVSQYLSPYGVKTSYNNVYLKSKTSLIPDIKSLLEQKPKFKIEKYSDPQVLIVHTHATECYMTEDRDYYTDADLTRTTDNSKNVTAIGDTVAAVLNDNGIVTLHDKTLHDYPNYNGSYSRSAATIKKYLAEYPSIKVVIDVHRDSIAGSGTDRVKPVMEINGKKTAQVLLVMGSEGEGITGFPNWKENLCFAVKYQQFLEVMHPGFARAIGFYANRYNEELTTGSILLEVGTESNTFEEANRAAYLAADTLAKYLNTLQ